MKKKYIILASVLFLLNMPNISASCTNEEIKEFKRNEDKYIIEYKKNTSTKSYDLYLTAPLRNKYNYRIISSYNERCSELDENTIKCTNFPEGKYEIHIKGITNTCNNILKRTNIEIPKYVSYSDDPLCEGIEDFVLCNPNYDKDIDYDTFVSRVNTYKKSLEKNEEKNNEANSEENKKINNSEKALDVIEKYIKEYWLESIIVIVFFVLLLITIIIMVKTMKKSRRLE